MNSSFVHVSYSKINIAFWLFIFSIAFRREFFQTTLLFFKSFSLKLFAWWKLVSIENYVSYFYNCSVYYVVPTSVLLVIYPNWLLTVSSWKGEGLTLRDWDAIRMIPFDHRLSTTKDVNCLHGTLGTFLHDDRAWSILIKCLFLIKP